MDEHTFLNKFKPEAQAVIDQHQIPGVSFGVQKDGEHIICSNFGYRHVEDHCETTQDTVFGIASMTKSFTCVAIMQLQEAGKLAVHDEVIKYLPEFKTPCDSHAAKVTIHHLMTHTSGLPPLPTNLYTRKRSLEKDPSVKDYPSLDLTRASGDPIDTVEELMDFIGKLDFKLLGDPGTEFSYSNDGYALLGAIISRVSGQTYEQYVTDHILKPAGMTHSSFFIDDFKDYENVTTLYAKRSGEVYAAPIWWDAPASRAAGALKSTVNDILKYTEIYRNGGVVHGKQILTSESVQQMIYPHVQFEPDKFYGYGLRITPDYYGSTLIEHGGGSKGVSSFMSIIPEKNITGVVLTNLAGVPAHEILLGALNVLQGKTFANRHSTPVTINVRVEDLHEFTGTYTSEEGMKLTFTIKEDKLMFDNGVTEQALQAISEQMFLDEGGSFIKFIKSGDKVERVFCGSRQIFKD